MSRAAEPDRAAAPPPAAGPALLPARVRNRVRADLGPEAAERWEAGLPALVSELGRRWGFHPPADPAGLAGGSAGYVVRVRLAAEPGERTGGGAGPAVLKLLPPGSLGGDGELSSLLAARGRGYARVWAYAEEHGAVLMEALGGSLAETGLPPHRQLDVLAGLLRTAWRVPLPPGAAETLPPEEEKAAGLGRLVAELWERHGRPCPEQVVADALVRAGRRAAAFAPERCVLVHGDPHPGNALRRLTPGAGEPEEAESAYAFVDPDGFPADPAYDAGVTLRDWVPELLTTARESGRQAARARYAALTARVAAATGLPVAAVDDWARLERVSTGLYLIEVGAPEQGAGFLETAALLPLPV